MYAFSVGVALALAVLVAPLQRAEAIVWGGQFTTVLPCFNAVTWTVVGPPRGGIYIWVPGATATYQYGGPSHAGQYGLGLAAPPYFCIASPFPLIVLPGTIMTMVGTST